MKIERKQPEVTRRKLVEAATTLMLKQGFNGTTIDEICDEAGLTKGSFFYHFEDKEDIGQAAVKAFGESGLSVYADALKQPGEPLEQIHRLFETMDAFVQRLNPIICLVGMLSQEMSCQDRGMRAACLHQLEGWTETMRSRLEAAKQQLKPSADFDATEVAWFLCSIWQGSMLVGKTRQSQEMIRNNLRLARAYVDSLFTHTRGPVSKP
jgi:TetR/AcrR family transcriptional regulator, transcriptional repressor for nem operon